MCPARIDFDRLRVPPEDGGVLIEPDADAWGELIEGNRRLFAKTDCTVLGVPLSDWRDRTRSAVRETSEPVIVTGHQPDFIHPGIWAKHVVAHRFAQALGGAAVNLLVDHDLAKTRSLRIPVEREGTWSVVGVPFTEAPGQAFERFPPLDSAAIDQFEAGVRDGMGDRYTDSQMPRFFEGVREAEADSWVGRIASGRRAVEAGLGVAISDCRVSEVGITPLMADWMLHAERFARSYNRALAAYRTSNRVRGAQRPIPDLVIEPDRCELPLWVADTSGRRRRLFVSCEADAIVLLAHDKVIGRMPVAGMDARRFPETIAEAAAPWQIRPRALALMIWARLLLADLFIHGIGGAKYDRISDGIIADYYGVEPPAMTCVSATLYLALLGADVSFKRERALRRALRDLEYNPQRTLDRDGSYGPMIAERQRAIAASESLARSVRGDRAARRRAFERIRELNRMLRDAQEERLASLQSDAEALSRQNAQRRSATARDYFFGLYGRSRLAYLMDRLPDERGFRL